MNAIMRNTENPIGEHTIDDTALPKGKYSLEREVLGRDNAGQKSDAQQHSGHRHLRSTQDLPKQGFTRYVCCSRHDRPPPAPKLPNGQYTLNFKKWRGITTLLKIHKCGTDSHFSLDLRALIKRRTLSCYLHKAAQELTGLMPTAQLTADTNLDKATIGIADSFFCEHAKPQSSVAQSSIPYGLENTFASLTDIALTQVSSGYDIK